MIYVNMIPAERNTFCATKRGPTLEPRHPFSTEATWMEGQITQAPSAENQFCRALPESVVVSRWELVSEVWEFNGVRIC